MPSPTFLSYPKKMFISMSTKLDDRFEGKVDWDKDTLNSLPDAIRNRFLVRHSDGYHEENVHVTEDGNIRVDITRSLTMTSQQPLALNLQPANAPFGSLVMATPDLVFNLPVSLIPPSHIYLHREFTMDRKRSVGYTTVTCLVPLTQNADRLDIATHRKAVENSISPDADEDTYFRHYHGELMLDFHVLKLDYTRGIKPYNDIYHDIDAMLRHFT